MRRDAAPLGLALALTLATALLSGCGGSEAAPARSPSSDYGPPPPTTSQGEPIGADGVSPADKLATGPSIGSAGPRPAATPATGADPKKKAPSPPPPAPP